ncbi:MAG: hypothetical protein Q7U04_06140 [Bacteriovorax sp.]|nr:hypothetical protein [Bacteriovorax sp.]
MSFKRIECLNEYPLGEELTPKLIGIGFKLGGFAEENVNIEDCLIAAATEGVGGDFRTLSLLTDWFFIHHKFVNIDRLLRALKKIKDPKIKCYFGAIGKWLQKDGGYKKLSKIYRGEAHLLGLTSDYKFLIKRNGEDERFVGSKFLVANKTLRSRHEDILTSKELALRHQDYYYRILIGPSYRADMISKYINNSSLTASQLAKNTYGSFATAWEVMKSINLLGITVRNK